MNKLIVEYDPDNGLALPDNKSEDYVKNVIENSVEQHVVVGTELFVDLFRCAVVEKKIKHTKIKFLFKGETIDIDKYGTCREYPEGFNDVNTNVLSRILEWD